MILLSQMEFLGKWIQRLDERLSMRDRRTQTTGPMEKRRLTDDAEKYRAPALDKGLDILEYLAASPSGLSQADIAKGLGRATNEIYRMLNTLVRRNYVTRSPEGDRYMLSLKLLVLANMHPPRRRILDIAEPLMRTVTQRAEQSCHLVLWEDDDLVVSAAFSAPGNWRLSLRPGAIIGLFNTGSGHVLAAFQSDGRRRQMINSHRLVPGEEVIPPDTFNERLSDIRKTGYSLEPSQTVHGVINMSFPILDPMGNAMAALTCPFVERIDDYAAPDSKAVTQFLSETAREISSQLSGQ